MACTTLKNHEIWQDISGCLMNLFSSYDVMQIPTWRSQLFRNLHKNLANSAKYLRSWKCFCEYWHFYFTKSSVFYKSKSLNSCLHSTINRRAHNTRQSIRKNDKNITATLSLFCCWELKEQEREAVC